MSEEADADSGESLPAWWGNERTDRNSRSAKQEKMRASQTGGRVSAGSGSSWRAPQDVRSTDHLEQVKFTDKAAYRLNMAEWNQIRADADRAGRSPRLVIDFASYRVRLVVNEEPFPDGGV